MAKAETFILGRGSVPSWFNDEANKGRAKLIYNEDEELIGAKVFMATKMVNANVGDTIMLLKSGLAVVPREKAKKYKVQNDVKENGEGIQQNMDN